jgi:hypothetical protein
MSEIDRRWEWKIRYWAGIRDFAQDQLKELRRGQFELTDNTGRDLIPDQIAQHERDLAQAEERLEDLRSN